MLNPLTKVVWRTGETRPYTQDLFHTNSIYDFISAIEFCAKAIF